MKFLSTALWKRAGLAALIAVVVNVILYFIGQSLGWQQALIPQYGEPIMLFAVIMFSILPVIVATVLFWLLVRFVPKYATWSFLGIAAIAFILEEFPIFQLENASLGVIVVLHLMHLTVAIPTVYLLLTAPR